MDQLIAMVRSQGRYPSSRSPDPAERTLAARLGRRHREAAHGTLAPAFRDGLASLPDWQEPAPATAVQARWQRRLAELAAYRAAGNDWPRHKNTGTGTGTGLEHTLGVPLPYQRINLRCDAMDAAKVQALDAALPGWRTGRTPGKKRASWTAGDLDIPKRGRAGPHVGHPTGPVNHPPPAKAGNPVADTLSAAPKLRWAWLFRWCLSRAPYGQVEPGG
ncbi:hypothetical protein [Pseudarthrobacter albicanus]|uniref:hypothetical protein n=1 Tax=Pseudarthrobacter albicanus TaxID=2823873 RepID=UPI001BA53CD9|nr:hypothetical protein [Pseudarthrobacter albicanus]